MQIYNLDNYEKKKNTKGEFECEKYKGDIEEICKKLEENEGYHLRLQRTDNVILFGDLDGYKGDIQVFFLRIQEYFRKAGYEVDIDEDIKYTLNSGYKKEGISLHYSIPKYYGFIQTIKKMIEGFKKEYDYGREIDTSVYGEKWWRLPNQKKESKGNTEHKIVEGVMRDFVVTYIPEWSIEMREETNDEVMSDVTCESINTMIEYNSTISKIPLDDKEEVSKEEIKEISEIINIKYIDSYNDWIRILWSIKSHNDDNRDIALNISKKSSKFNNDDFEKYWNQYRKEDIKLTLGTLRYYARMSNNEEYMKVRIKHNQSKIKQLFRYPTQENLAIIFDKIFGDDFIYNQQKVYYFNGIVWETSENSLRRKFTGDFTKIFLNEEIESFKKLKELEPGNDNYRLTLEKNKLLIKIIGQLQSNSNIKAICNDAIKPYIENNKVSFEKNAYVFCFTNKVYDLKKYEFFDYGNREDYMTMTTGYEYRPATKTEKETLNNILSKIFPIEIERKLYLTILSTGLYGMTLEKFILANGSGRNGKGLINELAEKMFGNYAYNCNNAILLNAVKDGANQSISNMDNKRIIFYREPNAENQHKLDVCTIKEITGGSKINARALYSTNTDTNLKGTHIMECNEKPLMRGQIDKAIMDRYIDIKFRSTFTDRDEEVNEEENIYKCKVELKEINFQEEHKYALFEILIEHWKEYNDNGKNINKFIPDYIRDEGDEYLKKSNEIFNWFDENYEKTEDDTDIIKLADIYEEFKLSDIYINYTKAEKREMNKNKFIDKLSKNIFLRKYYKEKDQRVEVLKKYNISTLRNILIKYKLKII